MSLDIKLDSVGNHVDCAVIMVIVRILIDVRMGIFFNETHLLASCDKTFQKITSLYFCLHTLYTLIVLFQNNESTSLKSLVFLSRLLANSVCLGLISLPI